MCPGLICGLGRGPGPGLKNSALSPWWDPGEGPWGGSLGGAPERRQHVAVQSTSAEDSVTVATGGRTLVPLARGSSLD